MASRGVGAHLVGALQAADAETAMRTASTILGRHLHSVPDGETGERCQWIGWQLGVLTAIDGIDITGSTSTPVADDAEGSSEYVDWPAVSVSPDLTELPPSSLGYYDAAASSYSTFSRLRDEGVVPEGVKFQVSVPTSYASVAAWIRPEDQERFFSIYAAALRSEIQDIAREVPHDDLVVQMDVAVEIGVLSGAMLMAAGRLADREFILRELQTDLDVIPRGVERGIHLCYGDYKHRHFVVPKDLSLCVEVANATNNYDFVHMPADRETGRDRSYYEPLQELAAERLALGVIDYEGDSARIDELIDAASEGGQREFAVATECGMGRITERDGQGPSLTALLQLHAEHAEPVR